MNMAPTEMMGQMSLMTPVLAPIQRQADANARGSVAHCHYCLFLEASLFCMKAAVWRSFAVVGKTCRPSVAAGSRLNSNFAYFKKNCVLFVFCSAS
jgi:hypothetical protein